MNPTKYFTQFCTNLHPAHSATTFLHLMHNLDFMRNEIIPPSGNVRFVTKAQRKLFMYKQNLGITHPNKETA